MNSLPIRLKQYLKEEIGTNRILNNASWIIADRVIRIGISLFVGVWVARYLGPTQFGTLNYAQALVSIFAVVASLGLDSIVIRDIIRFQDQRTEILGSAFCLKVFGGFICLLLSLVTSVILRPDDSLNCVLVAIIAAGSIFQAFDIIDFWFQSQLHSKLTVIARNVASVAISIIKVLLILVHAPLTSFALAGLAEVIIGSLLLVLIYVKSRSPLPFLKGNLEKAKSLICESWPLIFSSMAIMVYMRIDQIMLRELVGEHDVGVYSAALKLSEIWYIFPMALASSSFPAIIKSRESSEELYYVRIGNLFRLMIGVAYAIAIPVSLSSSFIVSTLYGDSYRTAGPILAIHVWSCLFVFLGVAQGPWNITEGLLKLSLKRTMIGALCNIVLNILLIPLYKGMGAAIATLISQAVSAYLLNAFDHRTRKIFFMQTAALLLRRVRSTNV